MEDVNICWEGRGLDDGYKSEHGMPSPKVFDLHLPTHAAGPLPKLMMCTPT